jgi:hypothetical protein
MEKRIQPLKLLDGRVPKLRLDTVEDIYERGILEYFTQFAIKAQELRSAIRNNAIAKRGQIGVSSDWIDRESMTLFRIVLKHHFPQITSEQIDALIGAIEEVAS